MRELHLTLKLPSMAFNGNVIFREFPVLLRVVHMDLHTAPVARNTVASGNHLCNFCHSSQPRIYCCLLFVSIACHTMRFQAKFMYHLFASTCVITAFLRKLATKTPHVL